MLRKAIFWMHLIAGAFAGIVIAIMSFTGVALTYEKQILAWANHYDAPPPTESVLPLPLAELLDRAAEAETRARPSSITFRNREDEAVAVSFGRSSTLYMNPYTGEALGEGSERAARFFRFMTDWHRYLGATGENRSAGKAITGASNLAFLSVVASGIYLWWPRSWNWRNLKGFVLFRGGLRGKAREWNWHDVFGFWSALPLFLLVLSATVISYPWASSVVYRAFGEEVAAPGRGPRGGGPGGPGGNAEPADVSLGHLDALVARARQHDPDWTSITFQVPASTDAPVSFSIDTGMGGEPHKRSTLVLDAATRGCHRTHHLLGRNTGTAGTIVAPLYSYRRGRRFLGPNDRRTGVCRGRFPRLHRLRAGHS